MTMREHLDKIHAERTRAAELAADPQRRFVDIDKLVGTRAEAIARHKERLARRAEDEKPFHRGPARPRRSR